MVLALIKGHSDIKQGQKCNLCSIHGAIGPMHPQVGEAGGMLWNGFY